MSIWLALQLCGMVRAWNIPNLSNSQSCKALFDRLRMLTHNLGRADGWCPGNEDSCLALLLSTKACELFHVPCGPVIKPIKAVIKNSTDAYS